MSLNINDLNNIFNDASTDGTISQASNTLICNNLNDTVLMGCNGLALDEIESTEVTLITALYDISSSISYSKLTSAIINGQNELLYALNGAKKKDDIMMAQWCFNDSTQVLHSYVPIDDVVKLDKSNYVPNGMTSIYDVSLEAMSSNLAYAELLKGSGTPVQSIIVLFTDGQDTSSKSRAEDVKKLAKDLLKTEQYVLAYIGVGDDDHEAIAERMGFPSVIHTSISATEIRKAFQMMSESIINVSQSVINANVQNSFFSV